MVYSGYGKKEDEYDVYKKKKHYKSTDDAYPTTEEEPRLPIPLKQKDDMYELEKLKREIQVVKQAVPRMEELRVTSLDREPVEVVGQLFDRVGFLEERISDLRKNLDLRKKLHDEITVEIDKDIKEKEDIAAVLTDMNERRNFKLDISILRREKRNEAVQFWRDVLELETELQEVLEQHQTESRIASLFKKGDGQ